MTNKKEIDFLTCACCGEGFWGWQHYDRDTGYGICSDEYCANAYGYHTEIFSEEGEISDGEEDVKGNQEWRFDKISSEGDWDEIEIYLNNKRLGSVGVNMKLGKSGAPPKVIRIDGLKSKAYEKALKEYLGWDMPGFT